MRRIVSRSDFGESQFLCFFGRTHVKSISKTLVVGLLLLTVLLTGFGFCSKTNTVVIIAATVGCFTTLLLILLLIGVLFDKAPLFLPFLIVGGTYMSVSIILFVLYILIGTSTNLITYLYENNEWLKRTYYDYQIDLEDDQVRTITCVTILLIAVLHSIVIGFVWTVFFLTFLHIRKNQKRMRNSRASISTNNFDRSPTTPLNNRFNHNLFYADSSPSADFSQQTS
ncbi:hypothetical protein M3Y97_00228500 [Aphelenchoides bicaudatus]|nr:hypothetical protein M3Y97_00228500 [Aphelenchoides bicaudatus]